MLHVKHTRCGRLQCRQRLMCTHQCTRSLSSFDSMIQTQQNSRLFWQLPKDKDLRKRDNRTSANCGALRSRFLNDYLFDETSPDRTKNRGGDGKPNGIELSAWCSNNPPFPIEKPCRRRGTLLWSAAAASAWSLSSDTVVVRTTTTNTRETTKVTQRDSTLLLSATCFATLVLKHVACVCVAGMPQFFLTKYRQTTQPARAGIIHERLSFFGGKRRTFIPSPAVVRRCERILDTTCRCD